MYLTVHETAKQNLSSVYEVEMNILKKIHIFLICVSFFLFLEFKTTAGWVNSLGRKKVLKPHVCDTFYILLLFSKDN